MSEQFFISPFVFYFLKVKGTRVLAGFFDGCGRELITVIMRPQGEWLEPYQMQWKPPGGPTLSWAAAHRNVGSVDVGREDDAAD